MPLYNPCSPCCSHSSVTIGVIARCFNPGSTTPTFVNGMSATVVLSLSGHPDITTLAGVSVKVPFSGTYTVTITPKFPSTGPSKTETLYLSSTGVNQVFTFYYDSFVVPNCNCFCNVPTTLTMTSRVSTCNFGMFQSCSLSFGPPPPALIKLGFTVNVFTSSASFVDPISNSSFFYYFSCQFNQFYLTRIFPTSPYGSPYRDGILYSWIVGGYGNNCSPFQLTNGSAYPGSDANCHVEISG